MKISKKTISALAVLTLVAACGKDSGSSGKKSSVPGGRIEQEVGAVDGSNIDGHYQAKFITLNPHVNGTIPGSANFYRKEEKLYVYVRLFAGGVRAWHQQFVYTGSRCPTMRDDSNGDGFIDINEAEKVMGKILIPLDSDVSSQSSGRRFFPLADLSGYYHYERITNFQRFLRDLQEADPDPADDIVKLASGQGLVITGKTVLILGVSETVELPETVGTKGRHRAFQTFPIACGVFNKVKSTPGTPYVQDSIPGPVAEYQEGQDQPAPEDDTSTTGGGTSGGSTGSNESDDGDGPVSDGEGRTTTGGSTTGGSTTGGSSGSTTGGSSSGGGTSGESTTGGTSGGTTTGESTTGSSETTSSSSSSSSSSTTTTTGGPSSSSSTTTGTSTGGFLDSSSGV